MDQTDREPTYHFVSHSHWDREWYKTFETFRLDLVDMVNTLLELLNQNPAFKHFTLDGQTIVLEDYAEVMPERQEELRRMVEEKRISIGPWYVLPDEFLVSAESTVRNLLFGRRAGAAFGEVMAVGYIPDSFGHLAMMPAILRGFDLDTAILYRGFGGEPGQEHSEYRWRAADGSEVLMVHLPPNGYSEAYIGTDDREFILNKARELEQVHETRARTAHRLCLNGGDHHFPDSYLPHALEVMAENLRGRFVHSSLPDFVRTLQEDIRTNKVELRRLEGELRGGYRYAFAVQSGVYSSRMYLKQANDRCQQLLTRYAEPLANWATVNGRSNLVAMLQQAWQRLLQNHPHDSICGCSIDAVHREMMTRFEQCEQIAEAVIEKSLRHFYPDASEGEEHVVIFNPQMRPASQPVGAEVEFFRQKIVVGLNPNVQPESPAPLVSGFALVDSRGRELPFQILHHDPQGHGLRYRDDSYPSKRLTERFHILVDAENVPATGFTRFRVEQREQMPVFKSDLQVGENEIENDFVRVEVHANGSLSLHDKRNGKRYHGFHVFEDSGDAGDEYNYSYPRQDRIITSEPLQAKVTCVEKGPLRATLQVQLRLPVPVSLAADRQSRSDKQVEIPITSRFQIYHNQPRLEIETTIVNTAMDHRLRVLFRSGLQADTSHADSQFGITARRHRSVDPADYDIEVPSAVHPMQRGVTIIAGEHGLTVAAAGLPEYELKQDEPGTIALTLLRCTGRLSGGDLLTRPGGEAGWITEAPEAQCLGSHRFRYAVIPHSAQEFHDYHFVNEQLEAFHLPPRAFRRTGEPIRSLDDLGLELAPASLVVSAFKPAEADDSYVVRCYNPTANSVAGVLRSRRALAAVCHTQLNERDGKEIAVIDGHEVNFAASPFQIISLRLKFTGA